jgi:hypothetical protein
MLNLARDAEKLGSSTFACNRRVDLAVIVQQTLQRFGIAAAVRLIGAGHQQREVPLLGVVAREVGMNALGHIAEERFEARRWVELLGFASLAECGIVSLLRALTRLFGMATGGVGVVEVDFPLGDARFQIVKLSIENADLPKITAFEGFQLGADLGKLGFALGEHSANGDKLLALVEERGGVRGLLENDFGWHAASHEGELLV